MSIPDDTQTDVVTGTQPVSTGEVEYYSSTLTTFPNAIIMVGTGPNDAAADRANDAKLSYGFAANGKQAVLMTFQENSSGSGASCAYRQNAVFAIKSGIGTAIQAEFVGFVTDGTNYGVRLDWTAVDATIDANFSITFISCPAADVNFIEFPNGASKGISQYTGFFPNALLGFTTGSTAANPTYYSPSIFVASTRAPGGAPLQQRGLGWADTGTTSSDYRARISRLGMPMWDGTTLNSVYVSEISDDGYVISVDGTLSYSNNVAIAILSLGTGKNRTGVFNVTGVGVTGIETFTHSNIGFKPGVVIGWSCNELHDEVTNTDDNAGTLNIHTFNGSVMATSYINVNDGVAYASVDAASGTDTTAPLADYYQYWSAGAPIFDSDTPTMIYAGYQIDITTNDLNTDGLAWPMLCIEAYKSLDDPGVNQSISTRLPALLSSSMLNVLVGGTPLLGDTSQRYRNMSFGLSSYSHEKSANLGDVSCRFSVALPIPEIEYWLSNGVAQEVTVYNQSQQIIWNGMVNQVSVTVGREALSSGAFDEIVNNLSVTYRTVTYNTNPPIGGIEVSTGFTDNDGSVAKYGTISGFLNGGEMSDAEAAQLLSSSLVETSWPTIGNSISSDSGFSDVSFDCVGFHVMLNKYFYEDVDTGVIDASDKVSDIVGSEPNGNIFTSTSLIEDNTLEVHAQEDGSRTAMEIIQDIVPLGDSSDTRYIFGVTGHSVYYKPVPSTAKYLIRRMSPSAEIETMTGRPVFPWDIVAGEWAISSDRSIYGGQIPGTYTGLVRDTRAMFIETVKYTAPYSVSLTGAKVNRATQRLAKMGVGSTF